MRKPYSSRFDALEATHYDMLYQTPSSFDAILWEIERSAIREILDRHVGRTVDKSLLDFACGTGRILRHLENDFQTATGVDVSPAMTALAHERVRKARIVVGDMINDASLLPGPFDVITVFRFFLNAEPTLREQALLALRKRMHEKSVLIANVHGSCPSLRSLTIRIKSALQRGNEQEDINEISQRDFRLLAKRCGFEVVETVGLGLLTPKIATLLSAQVIRAIERWGYKLGIGRWVGSDVIYVLRPLRN